MRSQKIAPVCLALIVTACGPTPEGEEMLQAPPQEEATELGTAVISDAQGELVAQATLGERGGSLFLSVEASKLPGGSHGFHLHAIGQCEAPEFKSAGGHLNPDARQHGSDNPAGKHFGDLPNLVGDDAGNARMEVELSGDAQGSLGALFDADGTAVVIHADADDYATDPTGNAGSRIACGVLSKM